MAMTKYRDYTIRREDPRGVPYYWIWGETLDIPQNTDAYAVLKKKVTSITPVTLSFDGRGDPKIKQSLDFLKHE
jgi:broad specificity polyphosphatase/5'/3'-nucleotidase SurE